MFIFVKSLMVGASLALIPGPIFFELTKRTLLEGWRGGLMLVTGDFLANTLILMIAFSGNSFLSTSSVWHGWLLQMGGLLLLLLGVSGLLVSGEDLKDSTKNKSNKSAFVIGVLMALSSPLTIIAMLGIGSATVQGHGSDLFSLAVRLLLIATGIFLTYVLAILIIAKQRDTIPPRVLLIITRLAGGALIGFGCWFISQSFQLA